MQPQLIKTKEPILVRMNNLPPGAIRFVAKPNDFENPLAEITPDGIFRVHVDPTDENTKAFIDLVNRSLRGDSPLTAMEVINGEQDCHAQ